MKRIALYLATAALGSALLAISGGAWAQTAPAPGQMMAPAPGQLAAAPGQMGTYCATPAKTCALKHESLIGSGCSCRVAGRREQGTVASGYGYSPSAYADPFGGIGAALTAPVAAAAAAPAAIAGAATAPLMTGRSAATGPIGNSCTTPQKTCLLRSPYYIGADCLCRVPGGHAQGSVTP